MQFGYRYQNYIEDKKYPDETVAHWFTNNIRMTASVIRINTDSKKSLLKEDRGDLLTLASWHTPGSQSESRGTHRFWDRGVGRSGHCPDRKCTPALRGTQPKHALTNKNQSITLSDTSLTHQRQAVYKRFSYPTVTACSSASWWHVTRGPNDPMWFGVIPNLVMLSLWCAPVANTSSKSERDNYKVL